MIETIVFDVDDTLYDQLGPFRTATLKLFPEQIKEGHIPKFYLSNRKYSDIAFDRAVRGEITQRDLQIYRVKEACREFGFTIDDEKAMEFQQTYVGAQKEIEVDPVMVKLLDKFLAQGKQLAVLTNGESNHQMMKIKQLRLNRWFPEENLFISGSVGHAKPTIEIFNHLENKLNLNKEKTMFIGDSFENDVVGAKNAGWKAIWLNRRQHPVPTNAFQADYTISESSEVLNIFE
ncbi:HAD family hydrolase [Saliterribacillus persicus]|uniref:Putative hydrolase of the HAD superfamily n=1 Tax=Saliterribacillus persicus TaxID=930114 RepID=A0A368Y9W1_9BACI|nr:HAD family hydrolase [Saliterribacillus persicus]RCW76905.1 putative hydrolase of the HAD superfamily [Saliterribacillus persicus]